MSMKFFSPHQILLMRRESRAVMGSHAIGLWLLSLVLIATFLSIAFSAGSMAYLEEKMNDPFTFWLNVKRDSPSLNLRNVADDIMSDSLPERFLYNNAQTEIATSIDLFSKKEQAKVFTIQHYEDLSSDLIQKVLGEDNVIKKSNTSFSIKQDSISDISLGVIMTLDAIMRLGYNEDYIPAFVNLRLPANDADTLMFKTIEGFVRAPIPLLAVVRRLPMNKDILSSRYMYVQYNEEGDVEPFNLSKEHYARRLYFFVPTEVEEFDNVAMHCIPDSLHSDPVQIEGERIQMRLRSWRSGCIKKVCIAGLPDIGIVHDIEQHILRELADKGVERVYDYDETNKDINEDATFDNGLSIHFAKLDSIRAFEKYVTDRWKNLIVEMSQVNSKENFNAVSTMANILTFALIVFSIIAIIIFIVNMMQSYFQKVKRNLGTFKAFGMSSRELIKVYVTIIVGIVLSALAIALAVTWGVELVLCLFNFTKAGGAPHLILWNSRTLWAIVIILASTVLSVLIVMRRLLRHTPGDLIYDR